MGAPPQAARGLRTAAAVTLRRPPVVKTNISMPASKCALPMCLPPAADSPGLAPCSPLSSHAAITFSVGAGIPLLGAAFIGDWQVGSWRACAVRKTAEPARACLHGCTEGLVGSSGCGARLLQCLPAHRVEARITPLPSLPALRIPRLQTRIGVVLGCTTVGLASFGSLAAYLGGANKLRAAARVLLGGWAAMGITYGVGSLFELAA